MIRLHADKIKPDKQPEPDQLHQRLGDRLGEADALYSLGVAHIEINEDVPGVRHLEEALDIYRSLGNHNPESWTLGKLAEAYAKAGREAQALASHQAAVEASREASDRHLEAEIERAWGNFLFSTGRRSEAVGHLRNALALLEALQSSLADDVRAEVDRASRSDS